MASPVPAPTPPADDLTAVRGIGPVYAQRLAGLGITHLDDLASADAERLAEGLEISPATIADWQDQARELRS
jgi:predicted flap endonuclease-1-like 5' DNA nuclease